jgi:hypothetical protein
MKHNIELKIYHLVVDKLIIIIKILIINKN